MRSIYLCSISSTVEAWFYIEAKVRHCRSVHEQCNALRALTRDQKTNSRAPAHNCLKTINCSFWIMYSCLILSLQGTQLCASHLKEMPSVSYPVPKRLSLKPCPAIYFLITVSRKKKNDWASYQLLWPQENNEQTAAWLIDESTSQRLH